MIDYIVNNMWLLWSIVAVVCLALEMSSGDFFVTCFAIGALVSVLTALLGTSVWLQVLVFAVFSMLSIWLIRPKLISLMHKGLMHKGGEERVSNADALTGRIGEVTETISKSQSGYVRIDGDRWRAVSASGDTLEVGRKVRIVGRESTIVTVVPEE